jgi:septal ring factor EnvC (AmiA/AmiB activator)
MVAVPTYLKRTGSPIAEPPGKRVPVFSPQEQLSPQKLREHYDLLWHEEQRMETENKALQAQLEESRDKNAKAAKALEQCMQARHTMQERLQKLEAENKKLEAENKKLVKANEPGTWS